MISHHFFKLAKTNFIRSGRMGPFKMGWPNANFVYYAVNCAELFNVSADESAKSIL